MSAIRSILITDSPAAAPKEADVVLWLGSGHAPPDLAAGRLLIEPSSRRAAAVYVAAGPARLSLALADPLSFASLVVEVGQAAALRAA
ncbi:MAG TPA: hypothetical protein VH210_03120 [Gaiellaceae bacterium]|jgi:hypothetical protein|nr:hypothetical protein [Gaiellaceae bacterium]